jgi:anti-sigma-K factor RskA
VLDRAAAAALGALDGEERAKLERALQDDPAARRELEAFAAVAARIGLDTVPVTPPPALRRRVLAATEATVVSGAPVLAPPTVTDRHAAVVPFSRRDRLFAQLATAAAVVFAVAFVVTWVERDEARRGLAAARLRAEAAATEMRRAQAALKAVEEQLAQQARFRALVSHPEALFVSLGPLPPAPAARGRVVFNRVDHQAVLIVAGLEPAPAGRTYEAWAIGTGAPVPAGLFQVDAEGRAVVALQRVAEAATVKTFAVTLEPAGGVPAPTGPMVLAGAVS